MLLAAAILSLNALTLPQDAPTLKVGSPAPVPEIEHWVKGETPKFFESGKVYVVEFWATWCGPCRSSMPHLTELQKSHPDVVIVGVSDEKLEKVEPFINSAEWEAKTQYRIATDPDRSTHDQYMKAAGKGGIPTAFIVGKDGVIEWIGHPMGMDEPLDKIVTGKWNREEEAKVAAAAAEKESAERQKMMALREEQKKLGAALQKGITGGDWAEYKAQVDGLIAKSPERLAQSLSIQKFKVLLGDANEAETAYAWGTTLLGTFKGNAQVLNDLAWFVVDDAKVKERNLDFAMKAATAADDAAGHKDGSILDTLARVYWEKGDRAKAIEIQKQAVALSAGSPMENDIKETLKRYEDAAKSR